MKNKFVWEHYLIMLGTSVPATAVVVVLLLKGIVDTKEHEAARLSTIFGVVLVTIAMFIWCFCTRAPQKYTNVTVEQGRLPK